MLRRRTARVKRAPSPLHLPIPQAKSAAVTSGITIGTDGAGKPLTLDVEELLATRLLVQGNSGSGKSHLLRRLLEESAPLVQQVVIDPEGDFVTLADAFGHVVIEAGDSRDLAFGIVRRLDHDMAVGGAERDEITLRIDHHLLDQAGAFLQQAAKQVRLARSAVTLNQQTGGEKLFDVHLYGSTGGIRTKDNLGIHAVHLLSGEPTR